MVGQLSLGWYCLVNSGTSYINIYHIHRWICQVVAVRCKMSVRQQLFDAKTLQMYRIPGCDHLAAQEASHSLRQNWSLFRFSTFSTAYLPDLSRTSDPSAFRTNLGAKAAHVLYLGFPRFVPFSLQLPALKQWAGTGGASLAAKEELLSEW